MSGFFGDNRLRHRIVFERNTFMKCVFCGNKAETREHAPSKVFLKNPFPDNLPVVPSCKNCNIGYSCDELYVALLLDLLKSHFYSDYLISEITLDRLTKSEGKQARFAFEEYILHPPLIFNDLRIKRVLQKLAICHATYEVSDGYHGKSWENNFHTIDYFLLPYMTQDNYDDIDSFEVVSILPEVGSIGYNRIVNIEVTLSALEDGTIHKIPLPFAIWNDVQDDTYRYLSYVTSTEIIVKIVIGEFLFSIIRFIGCIK